jgi:hypothetical protein
MLSFLDGSVAFQSMENQHKHLHLKQKMLLDYHCVSDLGSDRALQQFPEL